MLGWIILGIAGVALIALLWWGTSGPPTRPRPRSRYRGPTYLDIQRQLQRRRRR